MAFVDSKNAIGATTSMLKARLRNATQSDGLDVTVGWPESQSVKEGINRLNLFLYEIHFDEYLKNVALDEKKQPPLWLVLRYLLTAFDTSGKSDSIDAHRFLGAGIRALQGLNFMSMRDSDDTALNDNPENLAITFNDASHDILGKIMQGSDERYRLSASFEVRPVMIANPEPPSYSLLVGVDYTSTPPSLAPHGGINIQTLPFLGPVITSISPAKFEKGSTIVISGENFNVQNLTVVMDSTPLEITSHSYNKIECKFNNGEISAGGKAIRLIQNLANGIRRPSNVVIGTLLPVLNGVDTTHVTAPDPANPTKLTAKITLSGTNLGKQWDDIYIALYQNGKPVKFVSNYEIINNQTKVRFAIGADDPVLSGKYYVILVVNGQPAKNSHPVNLHL